jgi:type II secretory pathway component PulL
MHILLDVRQSFVYLAHPPVITLPVMEVLSDGLLFPEPNKELAVVKMLYSI